MFEELSGAALAVALDGVDVGALEANAALGYALAMRRVRSWACAGEAGGLARLAERFPADTGLDPRRVTMVDDALRGEVRAAYGVSSRGAGTILDRAVGLGEAPALRAALAAGQVDEWRAQLLLQAVDLVDGDSHGGTGRGEVVDRVLVAHAAADGGLTVARWRTVAVREALSVDPAAAQRRREETRRDRSAWHRPLDESSGQFGITGPVERTTSCEAAVDELARAWRAAGRVGTLQQLRFDATVALLLRDGDLYGDPDSTADDAVDDAAEDAAEEAAVDAAEAAATAEEAAAAAEDAENAAVGVGGGAMRRCSCGGSAPRRWAPLVNVTVPLSTLLGVDDAPGELAGVGPVPASLARDLAAQAPVWQRLLTDPVGGHLVVQDVERYRVSAAQRRFLLARYGGCAARGCTARRGLQIDHDTAYPTGATSVVNEVPFCPHDHDGKTKRLWKHHLDPETGALTQTSPLGRTYVAEPHAPPGPTGRRVRHVCGPATPEAPDDPDEFADGWPDRGHDPDCRDAPVRRLTAQEAAERLERERVDPRVWAQIKASEDAFWADLGPDGPFPSPDERELCDAALAFDREVQRTGGFDVDHPYFLDPVAWLRCITPTPPHAQVTAPDPDDGPPPF